MNKPDISERADLEHLVSTFYASAITDPVIGHFFTTVVALDLEAHLPVIVDFWESVLFGRPVYRGNPMLKHLDLARKTPFLREHVDRWLELWEASIAANFQGERAETAVSRARSIGGLMLVKVRGISPE